MTNKVKATFIGDGTYDNGNEAGGYEIYKFSDVTDINNNKYGNRWMKRTKLLEAVNLKKGVRYEIGLSASIEPKYVENGNMPFPTRVKGEDSHIAYLKIGGSIFWGDK